MRRPASELMRIWLASAAGIDEAPGNAALEPYDINLLKGMFLIRYIPDIVKPNVDNLATLCVNEVDADKLALKRRIQESLARLEQQRLVSRNGDLWFFLTNEERDVAREIGHVEVGVVRRVAADAAAKTQAPTQQRRNLDSSRRRQLRQRHPVDRDGVSRIDTILLGRRVQL